MSRPRVAVVVPRCHETVVGGAESLAWQYANFLKQDYAVDVITTRAVDAGAWHNHLPAGIEERDGICIRRFTSEPGHTPYWQKLHELLVHQHRVSTRHNASGPQINWTTALQWEWLRAQGPYSPDMLVYMRDHRTQYRAWIFVPYLFWPAVAGVQTVGSDRSILVPALHDEPPAYLKLFEQTARKAGRLAWNTRAEAELGARLWGGDLPGALVSMAVETNLPERRKPRLTYILYCGRIDPGKGCAQLMRYYRLFQKQHPGPLKLLLTGNLQMKLPKPAGGIRHLGYVSDSEKLQLMAGARAVIAPSPNESLSLITLEAMSLGTPVLVYGRNPVLREHVEQSGGGLMYSGYQEFRLALGRLLGTPGLREEFGAKGEQYVREKFSETIVRQRLRDSLAALPAAAPDGSA